MWHVLCMQATDSVSATFETVVLGCDNASDSDSHAR